MTKHFRQWERPSEALDAIRERIEADLGPGDPATAGVAPSRLPSGILPLAWTGSAGLAAYESNRAYVEHGDHWQNGTTWPIAYPDGVRESRLAKIRPMFCAIGMVEDGVGRQRDALFGHEPTIKFEPVQPAGENGEASDAQRREIAERVPAFAAWWDRVGLWDKVRKAGDRAAWGRRGPLRLRYLPAAIRQPTEAERRAARERGGGDPGPRLVGRLTGEQALDMVALSAELPLDAYLYTDPDTQERCAIIRVPGEDGRQAEAEVWFTDRDGTGAETVVRRILRENVAATDFPLPGAALPLYEITGDLLVTASVRSQQAQIDYIATKRTRVVQTAGDRERYLIDSEDPGEWSATPTGPGVPVRTSVDSEGNTLYFHPGALEAGPELVGMVQSRIIEGAAEEGEEALKAQVVLADPVDPEYIARALGDARATLRQEMKQGHVGGAESNVSAEKVKQDRADFGKRCDSYRQSAELAIAGVLTGAGRNAALLTAEGDWLRAFMRDYRIVVTLRIDTGPLTAEEIKQEMDLADRAYKPRMDVMAAVAGVEDFAAAEQAIAADPVQRMRRLSEALDVAEKLSQGWNAQAGVAFLRGTGLADASLLAAMERGDFTGETP